MRTHLRRPASLIRLACAVLLAAVTGSLAAQDKPAASPGDSSSATQPAKRDLRFEVASIRPSGPPTGRLVGPLDPYSPGRYRQDNPISLAVLAEQAFGAKHRYQIEFPHWMLTSYFTVNATLPDGATRADVPTMLQHLLEERFGLVLHRETRSMAGYELLTVKRSPGLTKSIPPSSDAPAPKTGLEGLEFKNGMPQFAKDAGSAFLCVTSYCIMRGRAKTIENLASDLADRLQAPVVDTTGLRGPYDYTLIFTDQPISAPGAVVFGPAGSMPANPTAADASAPLEHPLLRDALQEQLGLKLQPVKSVPIEVIVIDSASKQPTEN